MMGLDITAYRKLSLCTEHEDGEGAWEAGHIYLHHDPVSDERGDLFAEGCYRFEEQFGFRAGSYSGYNAWRDLLCNMSLHTAASQVWKNPHKYEGRPFYELINFSDAEGVIGPIISKKLMKDFQTFLPDARMVSQDFLEKYANWLKAFELASDRGAVNFH